MVAKVHNEEFVLYADDSKMMKIPPPLTPDEERLEAEMIAEIEREFFGTSATRHMEIVKRVAVL